MRVYAMNISGIDAEDKRWYSYLSERRAEKVNRLKHAQKKAQSIGAELLLNYAVKQETKAKTPVNWDTDENGKLYLTDYDKIYVNLSHSGDYAVCAVNDKPVGADIQRCRECDIKTAERFFTADEAEFIALSQDKNSAFFEIWTKKESFLKAIGRGITIPLSSFSVLSDSVEYDGKVYLFKEYTVSRAGYKLFVCRQS
ncbi:MAG: 4'-phosphopantetheinyl transferase superfamily protein [Oscillospiraceae bacterium]|nr:4'-phosphopantetheinyl transferase superfamily protein [Oscillospiraceae bacterium]